MDMRKEYSERELALFIHFGYEYMIDIGTDALQPDTFYQLMVEVAFLNNMKGPKVDSLRRCYFALKNRTCYRGTPEWDAMIKLSS